MISAKLKVSVLITGASVTGKTTLCRRLLSHFLVSPDAVHMTRQKRKGELSDVDAVFVSEEAFKKNFDKGFYLHKTTEEMFFNNVFYGCPKTWLTNTKNGKYTCFVSPTVKLAQRLKEELKDKIVWIHLTATEEVRKERLDSRGVNTNKKDRDARINAGNKQVNIDGHDILIDTTNMKAWEIFFHAMIKIIKCAE